MLLLKLISLLPKSVLFTKLACFNLALTFSAVNLLNLGVVIYLSLLEILFLNSLMFLFKTVAVTKPLVSGIFLSTCPLSGLC